MLISCWLRLIIFDDMNINMHDVLFTLKLYMHLYFLYVDYILTLLDAGWTPTPLWCRLVGWWHIIDVSFSRMASKLTRPLSHFLWSLAYYCSDYDCLDFIYVIRLCLMNLEFILGCIYFDIWCMTFCCWDLFPQWLDITWWSFDLFLNVEE
jgi:hypothetical protein